MLSEASTFISMFAGCSSVGSSIRRLGTGLELCDRDVGSGSSCLILEISIGFSSFTFGTCPAFVGLCSHSSTGNVFDLSIHDFVHY